jgi:predicted DNA-binding ribbon-helix-helix protein
LLKTENAKTGHLKKRSFALSGHRTSVALEAEFWAVLEAEAHDHGLSLAGLVATVDSARAGRNLASALRLHALKRSQGKNSAAT